MQDRKLEVIINRHRCSSPGYRISRGDVEYLIRKIEHLESVLMQMAERACDMVEDIEIMKEIQDALLEIEDEE